MSTERIINALNGLRQVAERIRESQRFGQPLPVDTTKGWAQELERIEAELRDCTGIRVGAPAAGPVKDFTVIAHH